MDKLLNLIIILLILKFHTSPQVKLNDVIQMNKQIKIRKLNTQNNSQQQTQKGLEQKLCNTISYYHWNSSQHLFNFFENNQGTSILHFSHKDYIGGKLPDNFLNSVYVRVFDPKYTDKKKIFFEIPLQLFYDPKNQYWNGTINVNFTLFNHDTQITQYQQSTTFFLNQTYCNFIFANFTIQFTLENPPSYRNLPWIMTIPPILIFLIILKYSTKSAPPQSISVLTICIILNYLIVVGLLELAVGISNLNDYNNLWIMPSIMTLTLIFRIGQVFQQTLKKITGLFGYIKFYILSGIYMLLFISFVLQNWFIMLNSFWLLPQIILNVQRGVKQKFNIWYIMITVIPQIYIMYVKGYSDNIFRKSPELSICFTIILIYCIQIIILYGQSIYGSRFFIPKRFLPNYYQYRFTLEINSDKNFIVPDCAICLTSLQYEDINDINSQKLTQQPGKTQIKKVTVLNTPCGHMFHIKCLQDWMQLKLECPIDRSVLPVYQ